MMTLEEAIKSLGDSYEDAIRVLIGSGVRGRRRAFDNSEIPELIGD